MKKYWLTAGIIVLLGMSLAGISCEDQKVTSKAMERVSTATSAAAKAGPQLPDLAIDKIEMVYWYQYKGQQPVTALTAPFSGNVRTDINWLPKTAIPDKYGTTTVFTLSNSGAVDWLAEGGGRINVYVDNFNSTWTTIKVDFPGGRLKAGETYKYFNDSNSGADFIWATGTKNYLFEFYNKGNEISKENNKVKTTVNFYIKTE